MPKAKGKKTIKKIEDVASYQPQFCGESTASDCGSDNGGTSLRRDRAATITRTDRYKNIQMGLSPYCNALRGSRSYTTLDIQAAVELSQMAYWNVPIVKNVIDVMTDISNGSLVLRGGNKASKQFIGAWLDRVNIWDLKQQFFREFFRSGNVFMYRFDGIISEDKLSKITQVYGEEALAKDKSLPLRYHMINPAYIRVTYGLALTDTRQYYQIFNSYQLQRLKNPQSPEDKAVYDALPDEQKKELKTGQVPLFPLDMTKLHVVFNKKQDYEDLAVPMVFPVLEDINAKIEMKKIDMAIARTTDRAILLVTMGGTDAEGNDTTNYKNLAAMQTLFQNESVKRVLVADHTTKAEWAIPEIDKILGPEKYKQINDDIATGLNAVLFSSDEKFSNTSIKVQVFMERLKEARNAFIQMFLQPEIKRICRDMNFKVYPEVAFEDVSFRDEVQWAKIFAQLAQYGILTADETLNALETGKLPTVEESLESQTEFKKRKDDGLYVPLLNNGTQESGSNPNGRPSGSTGIPKSSNNRGPNKKTAASEDIRFSVKKISENYTKLNILEEKVREGLLKKYKIKTLTSTQETLCKELSLSILINEKGDLKKISDYIKNPKDIEPEINGRICSIAVDHGVVFSDAAILYFSKQ